MKYELDGREVEIDGINLEVGEGAYVQAASFVDTGEELTDDERYRLEDIYAEALYEDAYMNAVCAAEARADAMEDR